MRGIGSFVSIGLFTGAIIWNAFGKPFPHTARRAQRIVLDMLSMLRSGKKLQTTLEKRVTECGIVELKVDWMGMRRVSVVIPVFNGFHETKRCIESVLANLQSGHRVIIVDDASTDARMEPYYVSLLQTHPDRVSILRNEKNSGFVISANRGIQAAEDDDVMLLNNDTVVPPIWIERLQEAAYSQPDAASVTPLSNQASIYSVLRESIDALLDRFTVNDIDRHIERHAQMRIPEIPTGVGFCMFMRRDVIDHVGVFDERFGIGYGEENDWCMRAKKRGYCHYLHDGCFVYHAGHVSMKEAGHTTGEETIASHEMLLEELHPEYMAHVQRFMATNTMALIKSHTEGLISKCIPARKRVLYVLHHPIRTDLIGGVEYHVSDLSRALESEYECFIASSDGGNIIVQSECGADVTERLWQYAKGKETDDDILAAFDVMLSRFSPDVVHVHHLMGLSFGILPLARSHGAAVVYNVHDWLFTNEETHPICTDNLGVIDPRVVARNRPFLAYAHAIITPSLSAMDIVQSAYGDLPSVKRVIPHGIEVKRRIVKPKDYIPTICFLSYVHAPHKGKDLVQQLVPHLLQRNVRIIFLGSEPHYWGKLVEHPQVTFAGIYQRDTVVDKLAEVQPNIVCILSVTPETYCYAVDDAWSAGLPVYCTPIGAPAERIAATGAGKIAPSFDSAVIAEDIFSFIHSVDYDRALAAAKNTTITSTKTMAEAYSKLYEELVSA